MQSMLFGCKIFVYKYSYIKLENQYKDKKIVTKAFAHKT